LFMGRYYTRFTLKGSFAMFNLQIKDT
jgi:hypothetical protein